MSDTTISPFIGFATCDGTSSPPTDEHHPLFDASLMDQVLIASILESRPHPLAAPQIRDISRYITQLDPDMSLPIQAVLEFLMQNTTPDEHAFLMHTLAAAASFHEASLNPRSSLVATAVGHYASAVESLPYIATPCFHLDIIYLVLNNVQEMVNQLLSQAQ